MALESHLADLQSGGTANVTVDILPAEPADAPSSVVVSLRLQLWERPASPRAQHMTMAQPPSAERSIWQSLREDDGARLCVCVREASGLPADVVRGQPHVAVRLGTSGEVRTKRAASALQTVWDEVVMVPVPALLEETDRLELTVATPAADVVVRELVDLHALSAYRQHMLTIVPEGSTIQLHVVVALEAPPQRLFADPEVAVLRTRVMRLAIKDANAAAVTLVASVVEDGDIYRQHVRLSHGHWPRFPDGGHLDAGVCLCDPVPMTTLEAWPGQEAILALPPTAAAHPTATLIIEAFARKNGVRASVRPPWAAEDEQPDAWSFVGHFAAPIAQLTMSEATLPLLPASEASGTLSLIGAVSRPVAPVDVDAADEERVRTLLAGPEPTERTQGRSEAETRLAAAEATARRWQEQCGKLGQQVAALQADLERKTDAVRTCGVEIVTLRKQVLRLNEEGRRRAQDDAVRRRENEALMRAVRSQRMCARAGG